MNASHLSIHLDHDEYQLPFSSPRPQWDASHSSVDPCQTQTQPSRAYFILDVYWSWCGYTLLLYRCHPRENVADWSPGLTNRQINMHTCTSLWDDLQSPLWSLNENFLSVFSSFHTRTRTRTHARTRPPARMRSVLYILKYGEVIRCYFRHVCLGIVKRVKCIRVHFLFIFW